MSSEQSPEQSPTESAHPSTAARNRARIESFYADFARLDGPAMQAAYAAEASFQDEAYRLHGSDEVGAMWTMLCNGARTRSKDVWRIDVSGIEADDTSGRAHWEAHYLFGPGGRKVHNKIDAAFTFTDDGLIATHRDRFDFWAWSRQALGAPGLVMGWSPMLRNKVQATAAKQLAAYRASNS